MSAALDFEGWVESIEYDLAPECTPSDQLKVRQLLFTSREPLETVRLHRANRTKREKDRVALEVVKRYLALAKELFDILKNNPCSRGEIRLAEFLLDDGFWSIQAGVLGSFQMTTRRNEVVNQDTDWLGSDLIGCFQPWVFSILERTKGIRRANFLYRLGFGENIAHYYCYSAYRRLLKKAEHWVVKKKFRTPDNSCRTLALRLGIKFLLAWAGFFSLKTGGVPRSPSDLSGVFLFRILKNVTYRDPVAFVMALRFFHEYAYLGLRIDVLLNAYEAMPEVLDEVDDDLLASWSLAGAGLRLETLVRHNLARATGTAPVWRSWQSTLAAWSWWAASRGDLELGPRLLKDHAQSIDIAEEKASTPASWIWEMCRLESLGNHAFYRVPDSANPASWKENFDLATNRDLGDLNLPYTQLFQALADSVPVDSFAMSVFASRGDGSSILKTGMWRDLNQVVSFTSKEARFRVLKRIRSQRNELSTPLVTTKNRIRDRLSATANVTKSYRTAGGFTPIVSHQSVDHVPADTIKVELNAELMGNCRWLPEADVETKVDRLLDRLRRNRIDLVYVGFFADGLKLLHLAASNPAVGRIVEVQSLTRRHTATAIADAWHALTFLPRGLSREYEEEKENSSEILVTLATLIAAQFEKLPLGRKVLIVPASPLHFLPLLPVLTLEVLIPRDTGGAVLDWTTIGNEEGREANFRTFQSAALREFGRKVDIRAEVDWSETGLEGEVILDPSVDELSDTLTSGADVVHIATHGFFDQKFPIFSGLLAMDWLRADVRYSPLFVAELAAQSYSSELVLLSACSTNPGGTFGSALDLSLSSILLRRGVTTVIGSLWNVDSEVSHKFAQALKRRIRSGSSLATAYAAALAELAVGGVGYRWLPFQMASTEVEMVFSSSTLVGNGP